MWLLGRMIVVDNEHRNEVLARTVRDAAVEAPAKVLLDGEAYFDLGDRQIFAVVIGGAALVISFDDRSSLGLVRLRYVQAKEALERALAARG